ncbi:holo-ACP synthase, partial [Gordonia sp. NPDC057248]
MSVLGVGIDIVSIPEFGEQLRQPGTTFADRFTV